MNGELMAINLSLEFEEIFKIQDALQYQQARSSNSKARDLNNLTFKLDQIVIKERNKLL
jgi:hypothetical protein